MRKIYNRCIELLEKNFKKGDEVGSGKLTRLIIINLGGDQRTISGALRVMLETKLIKDINNCHFKIL